MAGAKTRFLGAACILGMLSIVTQAYGAQETRTIKNNLFQYSIQYPAGVQVKQIGNAFSFVFNLTDKKFDFSPSVNIVAKELPQPLPTLQEFFQKGKEGLTLSGGTMKVIEEKKVKVAGQDAYQLVYTAKERKAMFKLMQYVFFYKNKAYVITYTALQDQYDKILGPAQAMVKSFKFSD